MRNRSIIAGCLLLVMAASSLAAPRSTGQFQPVQSTNFTTLTPEQRIQSFAAAVACTTASVNEIIYQMNGWVTGNELYKAYIDPTLQCANPYPYSITAVNMPMYFAAATSITVSVDIEEAVTVAANCKGPGNMLAISADYTLNVPAAGYYSLWIPLDAPVEVNAPFFAGFFIGSTVTVNSAILVDSFPRACESYNAWDTLIGFVDLCNFPPEFGSEFNFPGRLAMEVSGTPGGSGGGGTHPAPQVSLLYPMNGMNLYGRSEVWAHESSGSGIVDYVTFEYLSNGQWIEAGRDYDGTRPLRSGVASAEAGNGYSNVWDFTSALEGQTTIRVRAVDTLGREASDQVDVYLEPTPPVATIVSPDAGGNFCSPLSLLMLTKDQNIQNVQIYRKDGSLDYSAGVTTLHQQMMGDANGNPSDGNSIANGEFGNYYSGPAVGAMAVKLWSDRGYTSIMRVGFSTMTMPQCAETLATAFKTRANLGTLDELLFAGMKQYAFARGDEFAFEISRSPDYWKIRTWAEEEERAVMLGLGGTPSYWVMVEGFAEWEQPDGSFKIVIANPVNGGAPQTVAIRLAGDVSEIYVNGSWHSIDVAVTMVPHGWSPTRTLVGTDMNGGDGWSLSWAPLGLTEDNLYFFRTSAKDQTDLYGYSTVLLNYNCQGIFSAGDYTGDGMADLSDLSRLISFLTAGGVAPIGGAGRADANCDGIINVGDIIYYVNYMFGVTGLPCY